MLNLFIFWRRKKLSLFILSKAFTFRFDHSANEGIGFLWTIFPEQNPHKNSQYELYMKRKAFPLLFTCNSSSLATGARTEAFFVGVAVLPKLPLAFRQKTRSCLTSPDIFPRFLVEAFFGLWSTVKSESGWIWLLPSESFAVSATNSWTAEAVPGFPPTTLNIMRCWTHCWYLWTCVLQISYQNNPKYGGRQKEKERIFFEGTQFGKKTNLPNWVMLTTLSATLSTSMSANICTSMSAAMSSRCFVKSQGRWQDFKHIWAERFWRSPAWLSPLLKSLNYLDYYKDVWWKHYQIMKSPFISAGHQKFGESSV